MENVDNIQVNPEITNDVQLNDELPQQKERESVEESNLPKELDNKSHIEEDELPAPSKETEDDIKKPAPKWVPKRLTKKEKEIQQANDRAKILEEELFRTRTQQQYQQQNQASPQNYNVNYGDQSAPKRSDFVNEEDFVDARVKFNHNKIASEYQQAQNQYQQQLINEAKQKRIIDFHKKLADVEADGSERYDNFKEITQEVLHGASFPANELMAEAIVKGKYGADILVYLGNNQAKARKIAESDPIEAVEKIAELRQRFENRDRPSASKAPPVLSPVQSSGDVSTRNIDMNELDRIAKHGTQEQYRAARKKMLKK